MPLDAERARRFHNGSGTATGIDYVLASTVIPEPINWLWENYLALRKITLLGGSPDVGKTLIATDVVARVTNIDMRWPTGEIAPTGTAVILSAEDTAEDTIRPRLEAAGALLDSVYIVKAAVESNGKKRTLNLHRDLDAVSGSLDTMARPKLLTIDPITAYLGDIDGNSTTAVRSALEPLAAFANTRCIAVLGITHPPKNAHGNAINNFTGSLAFVAAPRLAFVAVKEQGTDRKLLLPVKNNIGRLAAGRGYRIDVKQVTGGIIAPFLMWDDEPVDITASEAMMDAAHGDKDGRLDDAVELLKAMLKDEPRFKQEIEKAAEANGISSRTLRRAKQTLCLVSDVAGFPARATWRLP